MQSAVRGNPRVRVITPALICPALIGREAEIDNLVESARAVGRGRGALVLLSGEAGIGKSRLIRELRDRLSNGRGAFAVGSCTEFGQAPYGPFLELLDALGAGEDPFGHETLAEQFNAIAEEFNRLSVHRATVCVIEDLHWADEGSLQLLAFLARRITRYRMLLIATYRSDELSRYHQALPFVARIARETGAMRMHLDALPQNQVHELLRLSTNGRSRLPRHVFDAIVQRCEGNPFFAEELMKNAYERLSTHGEDSLPIAIQGAVSERLKMLDAAERQVLEQAAVIGAPFTVDLLARVGLLDPGSVPPMLRAACDLQMLVEDAGDPVQYRFRHALTRDAVYAGMLAVETRPLHRRIAQALEELSPQDVAAIGHHWWSARDARKSRLYNERAAREAERVHSHADAIRLYERALEMTEDPIARAQLFGRIALALLVTGDADRARRIYETSGALYRQAGLVRQAAELDFDVINATYAAGDGERAMQLAQEAYDALPADCEPSLRLRMLGPLIFMHLTRGILEQARALLGEADALLPRSGDDERAVSMYHNTAAGFYAQDGDIPRFREAAAAYLEYADSNASNARLFTHSRVNVGASALSLGLDDLARTSFEEVVPHFHERKWWGMEMHALVGLAMLDYRHGELLRARQTIERAIALPVDLQITNAALASIAMSVGIALADEDLIARVLRPDSVDVVLRTQSAVTLGAFVSAYAHWLAGRGQASAALAVLQTALEGEPRAVTHGTVFLAAAQIGGEALCERVRVLFEQSQEVSRVPYLRAHRALFDALVAQRRGERSSASASGAAARALYDELGWCYYSAIADEAAGDAAAALEKYREMAAIRDIRRLELGVREETPITAAPQRGALSGRERQIAEMVAGGASNKAIAQQLFVSQKTVEKHITAIYHKLGFSRRSELTAYMVRGA